MPLNDLAQHFSLMRGGGIFFILIGLGIVIGSLKARWLVSSLVTGAVVAVLSQIVLGKQLFVGLPYPSLPHYVALGAGFLMEMLLINIVVAKIPDRTSRRFWLWILWAVGAHLLIFGFSHGPLSAALGLACIANATIGLKMKNVDFRWFWLADGLLKIGFGSWMVWLSQ